MIFLKLDTNVQSMALALSFTVCHTLGKGEAIRCTIGTPEITHQFTRRPSMKLSPFGGSSEQTTQLVHKHHDNTP